MAVLVFPTSPTNGQLYPSNPLTGQNQYRWESSTLTWRLLGEATGVFPGCYGDDVTIPTFCVDAQGRITTVTPVVGAFIKTNNPSAYNSYVWPTSDGTANQLLKTNGAGILSWIDNYSITVQPQPAPGSPKEGDLWFDCTTGTLFIYQSCIAPAGWFNVSQSGLPVDPVNVTAAPAFLSGSGTILAPYQCSVTTTTPGSTAIVVNTVTVTGLAPFQQVPIIDMNAVTNVGRFSFSNDYADATGTLVFQIIFQDLPASPPGVSYTAAIRLGSQTAYINSLVNVVISFVTTAGSISGTPEVGQVLTYTTGVASDGTPPYSYSWVWRRDGITIGGATSSTYTLVAADYDKNISVFLTATDAVSDVATATTTSVGPVTLATFPPSVWSPTPSGAMNSGSPGTSSGVWNGPNASLIEATGCVEVSVTGTTYSTSVTVNTGQTLYQRWKQTSTCGAAASGTTITGMVASNQYGDTYSLTLNRVPVPPISNISDTNVNLGSTITKATASSIAGINTTTTFVTYDTTSTGTTIQASTDNITFITLATSGTGFPVINGQTLYIRQTVGNSLSTGYTAVIRVGDGTNAIGTYDEFVYTATTVATPVFPNLPAPLQTGPTQIPQTASGTWADGPTTLTSTNCLLVSLDNVTFSQGPLSIVNGNTLYMKWDATGVACGAAANGTVITGDLTNGVNVESYSFTIDRVPAAIADISDTNVNLGTTVTKAIASPIAGLNVPAYVTYDSSSTGSTIQASTDNVTFTTLTTLGTGFTVTNGQTLYIRQVVGTGLTVGYTAVIRVGDGTNVAGTYDEFVYTATTASTAAFPNLPAPLQTGPVKTPETVSGTWADGSTSLTSTDCLLISTDNVTFNQGPLPIVNGNTLYMKWNPTGATCGDAADGTTITGDFTNGININSYSLTLDRTPNTFTLTSLTGQTLNTEVSSNTVTLSGTNAPTYLTYTAGSPDSLTTPKVSINSAADTALPTSGTTVSAPPGATLTFKGTTGSTLSTAYTVDFNAGALTRNWSVTTKTTPEPGAPYQGGFFAGQMNIGGTIYNLVVAPRTSGSLQGELGSATWATVATDDTVANNTFYGSTATTTYANAQHPFFNWAVNGANGPNAGTFDATNTVGTGIGGYNDWYIPSVYELMILYYYFKPSSAPNNAGTGVNPFAVAPCISPFTASDPALTTIPGFAPPGANDFAGSNYASATQSGSTNFRSITFSLGEDVALSKTGVNVPARAIRRVLA